MGKSILLFWNKYGHGHLIGYMHYPASFWNLRMLNNNVLISIGNNIDKIYPDNYSIIGNQSINIYKQAEMDLSKYFKSEALRYLYLRNNINNMSNIKKKKKILILGDIFIDSMNRMLEDLSRDLIIQKKFEFSIKFHSSNIIQFENISLKVVEGELKEILPDFDLIVCSTQTSASLDAILSGKIVIIYKDCSYLNFSPSKNIKGVYEISCFHEIENISFESQYYYKPENFFFINKGLPLLKEFIISKSQ